MKRVQLYIDLPTYRRAKAVAKGRGQTVSAVIRNSLKKNLQEPEVDAFELLQDFWRKHPTPKGTPTDLSYNHDHYLYGTPKRKLPHTK